MLSSGADTPAIEKVTVVAAIGARAAWDGGVSIASAPCSACAASLGAEGSLIGKEAGPNASLKICASGTPIWVRMSRIPGFNPALKHDLFALGFEIGECLRPGRLAKQSDLLFKRADRLAQELRGSKSARRLFPGFAGLKNGNARFVGWRLEGGHRHFHPFDLDRCLADLGGLKREIGGKVPGGLERAFGFRFLGAFCAAGTVGAVAADLFRLGGKPGLGSSDAVFPPPRGKGVHHAHRIAKGRCKLVAEPRR